MQVYLDNNATTPVDPSVLESMQPFFLNDYGNPSSIHSLGQRARSAVEEARDQVAELIGARAGEIVFTSGGTESDNAALVGVMEAAKAPKRHLITVVTEHSAILQSGQALEGEGCRVSYLPVGRDGLISLDQLREAIGPETVLISVMHANNETGVIQPIREIGEIAHEKGALFHTDAVQTVGKIPVDVEKLGVDLLSLTAHKFHGPKGVGALFVRTGVSPAPILRGGSHEKGLRAGTLNAPGIVGLGKTCVLAGKALEDFSSRIGGLRDRLERGIAERISDTCINGSIPNRAPHVSNISFRGVEGEALLISLDFEGIAVSTGSACSSGMVEASHVITAMGGDRSLHHSAIRFSLGRMNSQEDIDYVMEVLPRVIARMRGVTPQYRGR